MPETEVDFRTLPLPEVLRLFRENDEPQLHRAMMRVLGREVDQVGVPSDVLEAIDRQRLLFATSVFGDLEDRIIPAHLRWQEA